MSRAAGRGESRGAPVGTVVGISPSGQLTVRALGAPPLPEGSDLITGGGTVRGRVIRVFGPVARPFYSVRLARPVRLEEATGLVGSGVSRA